MRGFFGRSRSRAHLYNAVMRRMIPILFVTCFLATASGAAGAKGDPEQGRHDAHDKDHDHAPDVAEERE